MATKTSPAKSERKDVVSAGAAGGGIGTLLATFADSLPPESTYKTFITVTAPIATVGISGLWLFVKAVYIDPFAASKKHKSTHEHISKLIEDAKKTEKAILDDPNASDAHKKQIRKKVEELERRLMDAIVESIEYA